jgi:hypothetical protein
MADPGVRDGKEPLVGHEKYEKLKDLSAGAFGFVQLARNKRTGQHVAIKFLERVRCLCLRAGHIVATWSRALPVPSKAGSGVWELGA